MQPILTQAEINRSYPTLPAPRPPVSQDVERIAVEHCERADLARRDASLLLAQAQRETGLAAHALTLLAQRRQRIARDELAAADEAGRLAVSLRREGR